MNKRQSELLDRIKASGGKMWVESSFTYYYGRNTVQAGSAEMKTAHSMLSEKEQSHCPGGCAPSSFS